MLYDELVPSGKFLAHYGVPKDQWSPEARARHNRNHPGKTINPVDVINTFRRGAEAYDNTVNHPGRQGGSYISKVDEDRARRAELLRQHRRGEGYYARSKPDSGQHVESYRKPERTAKPRIHSSSSNSGTVGSVKPRGTGENRGNYTKPHNRKPSRPAKPGEGEVNFNWNKTPSKPSTRPVDKAPGYNTNKSPNPNKGNGSKTVYTQDKGNGAKATRTKSTYTQDKGNGAKATRTKSTNTKSPNNKNARRSRK